MKQPLVIMGSGGFGREALSWVDPEVFDVLAFYDEATPRPEVCDIEVVRDIRRLKFCQFLVAVGDPKLRRMMWDQAVAAGLHPCLPIIHETAVIGAELNIGRGAIVCPNTVITVGVTIGQNTLVNLACTLGHDSVLGDHSVLSPGVNVSGNVRIGEGCQLGTNSSVRERVTIGDGAVVGMGAVVLKDVHSGAVVVGNPARPLSVAPVP